MSENLVKETGQQDLWTMLELDEGSTIAFCSDDAMILSTEDYDGYTDRNEQQFLSLQEILDDMTAYEEKQAQIQVIIPEIGDEVLYEPEYTSVLPQNTHDNFNHLHDVMLSMHHALRP